MFYDQSVHSKDSIQSTESIVLNFKGFIPVILNGNTFHIKTYKTSSLICYFKLTQNSY
jgi:hypothetical protein